ncbi:MAG: UDP-N-acetylmuramoyl-tripeptide--D-alanyl-D-alanine ligase [Spirochaetales bacterium]|nr:UDP-N-acetylmuramoyl-tripeptide--D-alanyl-D-alanine ligase [Spirochaetales bacterium]
MSDFIFDARQIIELSDGELLSGALEVGVTAAEVDSRRCGSDFLFCCLNGEKTRGSLFVEPAIENGASIVLVDRDFAVQDHDLFNKVKEKVTIIAVDNPLEVLQLLAKVHISNFPNLIRVGITGSSGKTTTRELVALAFSSKFKVFSSSGNFNSDIGLPLMALRIRESDEVAVLEMGIDREGEMALLADIFNPQIGIITNIGMAHLGKFGSSDVIAREKSDIFKFFDEKSIGFLGEDEKYFQKITAGRAGSFKTFGLSSLAQFEITNKDSIFGPTISVGQESFNFPLVGDHNLKNLAAALVVCREFGIADADILRACSEVSLPSHRNNFIKGKVTVFEDCYNANPESMMACVGFFENVDWAGRKIAVFGSMKELGAASESYHSDFGLALKDSEIDEVFFFGEEMLAAYDSLRGSEFQNRAYWCESFEDLVDLVKEIIEDGDLILLKGSRSMELERLTDYLL